MEHLDPDTVVTEAQLLSAAQIKRPLPDPFKDVHAHSVPYRIGYPLDEEFDDFELGHQHIWK